MITKIKKLFISKPSAPDLGEPVEENINFNFTWIKPGRNNPFNIKILNIRRFALNGNHFAHNRSVEKKFTELRASYGYYLQDIILNEKNTIKCNLSYKHTIPMQDGIVFKADSMQIKWDIYLFNKTLYFSRSLSGELLLKANIGNSDNEIRIKEIKFAQSDLFYDEPNLAIGYVHFLIYSHLLNHSLPHPIPRMLADNDPMNIALFSYNQFGKKGWYATKDSILDVCSTRPRKLKPLQQLESDNPSRLAKVNISD